MRSIRAELYLLPKKKAVYALGLIWIAMSVIFGIGIPLIVYAAIKGAPSATVADPGLLLAGTLPTHIASTTAGLYPIYGAALMFVLGVTFFGPEFRTRTWATIFIQQPRRSAVVLGKIVALAIATVVITLVDVGVMVAASEISAAVYSKAGALDLRTIVIATLICLLVSLTGAALGATLATIFRGVAIAVGVGLIWLLAVENLLSGLAGSLPAVKAIREFLPAGSGGSLASYVARLSHSQDLLPGVANLSGPGLAVTVQLAYVAFSIVVLLILMRVRDTN